MSGLQKKETDLTARQAALQDGEQQLHAEKAGLGALEAALKEEYEVKSKECEAAAVNSKKELAAVVKERNALQQQLKEERQAHAKASQQQLANHAVEVQDGQQRTAGVTPTASIPIAPITPVEHQVQAADRGLTPPAPPGLARPSGTAPPSSRTIGSTESHASVSSNMQIAHSQAGRQPQGTSGSVPAFAPAARGGFGSTLRPELLRRLGNGDGKPFGEQALWSDRDRAADRQDDTSRPGLSNSLQTRPFTTDNISHGQPGSELGGSNIGDGRSSGVGPAPASSSTRRRGPPAHLVARLSRNPFEDEQGQADRHQVSGTAASQGSSVSGGSNRGRGRGRHATSGANHLHRRQQQQGGYY
ncbi:TPA: hypothetical protein ACH3X2_014240 [Trebouxia sp. C0005]